MLTCKNYHLKTVKSLVQIAVQDTVKTEIHSHSQAVKKAAPEPFLTRNTVKTAVKQANVKDDHSRSITVFWLKAEDDKQLFQKIDKYVMIRRVQREALS